MGKVKDALVIDISKPNPLKGSTLENAIFDVITTFLCLITAAPLGIEDFKHILQNIRYYILIEF